MTRHVSEKAVLSQENRAMPRIFAYVQWLFDCYYFTFTV